MAQRLRFSTFKRYSFFVCRNPPNCLFFPEPGIKNLWPSRKSMHFCPSARLCRAMFSGFRLRKQHKPFNLHTFRPGYHATPCSIFKPAQIAPTSQISLSWVNTATPARKPAHRATRRLTGEDAEVTFSGPAVRKVLPARILPQWHGKTP